MAQRARPARPAVSIRGVTLRYSAVDIPRGAADPRVVICDEVDSALDQLVAEGILRLPSDVLDRTGVSYMFITHDIATVRAIADEMGVMREGVVMDKGPRQAVLEPPRHPDTRQLLDSVPQMDPDWLSRRIAEGAE